MEMISGEDPICAIAPTSEVVSGCTCVCLEMQIVKQRGAGYRLFST